MDPKDPKSKHDFTNRVSEERLVELLEAIEIAKKSGDFQKWIEARIQFSREVYGVEPTEDGD